MKYPLWKPLLIVLVLIGCALMVRYKGLRPGLDLAGGTTLIYDVKVPEEANAERVIDDLINVLRDRVDPQGTRGLVWRQVAGNRIEIQMALAGEKTKQLRQAYLDARQALIDGNISRRQLEAALRLDPEAREQQLRTIAGEDDELRAALTDLAAAHDRLVETTETYRQIEDEYRAAREAREALPDSASDDEKDAAALRQRELERRVQAEARAYLDAKRAYEQAEAEVLRANVDPDDLQRVLELPRAGRTPSAPSPRGEALAKLKQEHPSRADEIDAVAEAYAAYEGVKGQLDDPNDLIALLQGSGVLEFRIAATPDATGLDVEEYIQQLEEDGPRAGRGKPWRWFEVDDIRQFADSPSQLEAVEQDATAFFAQRGLIGRAYGGSYYLLLANTPDMAMTRDQDWELTRATLGADSLGRTAINFELDALGGSRMGQITGPNVNRPMAILLDNQVISAPNLNSQIRGYGQISGNFSRQEVDYLLRTLKAGSTEAELGDRPISIKTTGPQLGQDNLRAGLKAAVYSLIAVAIFMALYYLGAGLVADFALLANMVIILGIMSLFEATFTLPGIAGIVLTIGMAVDANVLIFERLREEIERKADLRTAVRLGYEKALSTILDANITTFITCVVLFYTATAEIKGFATTLMVGILATLFTALFCTRVIFEMWLTYTKPTSLPMLPILIPGLRRLLSPNIDWLAKRHAFFAFSAMLMVVGASVVFARGKDMLDIEFRAGTQVSFTLREGETMSIGQVRQRLADVADLAADARMPAFDPTDLPESQRDLYERLRPVFADAERRVEQARADAERLEAEGKSVGDLPTEPVDFQLLRDAAVVTEGVVVGTEASAFSIATLITDAQAVSDVVKATFSDVLDTSRPISFRGQDEPDVNASMAVCPIRAANLGQNINRPDVRSDVAEYLGGVAIVLEDLSPPTTLADLEQRITRMRRQPAYEQLGYRPFSVIGLDLAGADDRGTPTYRSAVVVVRDQYTNYADSFAGFDDPTGLAATEWNLVRDALQRDTSLDSVASFSSQVSGTMRQQAIAALTLSMLAVVAYIWFRFGSLRYGLAAIAALVHDVLIVLGFIGISAWIYDNALGQFLLIDPFKINLATVAALLTLVGYSLNDTIVVFDRIRENRGRLSYATPGIINDSINQTISRSLLTSGTTMLAILVLYVFGGAGVHGFAYAMLMGVFIGTYSSIAVAAPLLLIGARIAQQRAAARDTAAKPAPAPAA